MRLFYALEVVHPYTVSIHTGYSLDASTKYVDLLWGMHPWLLISVSDLSGIPKCIISRHLLITLCI